MKKIFVSQRIDTVESYKERRDALDQNWARFLYQVGVLCVPVPNHLPTVKSLFSEWKPAGFLLTGGNSPVEYGGSAPERDAIDSLLLEYSIEHQLPLIGVCRGMQSILLHFEGQLEKVHNHVRTNHFLAGKIERTVNSYHELGVYTVPECFQILATAEDGVVEGIQHSEFPITGIMWHPERNAPYQKEDIEWFRQLWHIG